MSSPDIAQERYALPVAKVNADTVTGIVLCLCSNGKDITLSDCLLHRYILRLFAAMGTLLIITEQYMEPTIANSIVPLRELNVAHILERMLKLSIPTLYGWVIIFYALFHVWLNILAEITYFGDREFYKVRH